MPLMMDDDMEVDINDLFGDGADLPLPSRPPPKELFQRIDELRGNGCTQGIAWSKCGSIVSISQSGTGLEFRNLRCHPGDGSWDLTEPTVISQIPSNLDGGPLQHLCWSPNGSDLAVIDSAGRVTILAIHNALNRPNLIRSAQIDPAEDLHAVVGAFWLNLYPVQQRPAVVHSLAIKQEKEYRYEMTQTVSFGPCHPNPQKSALICLTTNGVIKLLWPQSDGKWHESTKEIEGIVTSNDLITHASICADKNASLLVAFATTTKLLRTIRVMIKWGNKVGDKNVNLAQVSLNPVILVNHLAVTNWMEGGCTDGVDSLSIHSSMATLSHLQILPPSPDISGGPLRLPTVLSVRSCLPVSPSHFNQDIHSIIDRWELRESPQTLHPAFEQLGSRKGSATQLNNYISLRKIEGFTINKIVIFVQSITLDRIIFFAYSDGSIEYRDRISLAETFTEGNVNKFTHMPQIGFSYADEEPSLQVALSPTGCSFVQICCDRKAKWKTLAHDMEPTSDPTNDVQYNAIVAGLTLSCSTAIFNSVAYDDLLAIAHGYTRQTSFSFDWLTELVRVLKFQLDYSEESNHDTLIRNPSIQILLCIQNSLGYNGDLEPRSFGAKLAWISLQIRNCVVLMTMANVKFPDPESTQRKISGLEDTETIRMLSGSVRWCLDLMSWIIDSLLNPEDKSIFKYISTGQPINLEELNSRLHTSNNVALHLLLSSASRGFLTAICRRLAQLEYTARKAMSTAAQSQAGIPTYPTQPAISEALGKAYTNIATLTSNSIVSIRRFEAFLTSISASVRDAYSSAGLKPSTTQASQQQPHLRPTESPRNLTEQSMLFGGLLPDELKPAITHVFTRELPNLRPEIDLARLYFHDFSLLALDPLTNTSCLSSLVTALNAPQRNSTSAASERVVRTIDVFQRVPIELGVECGEAGGSTVNSAVRGILTPAKHWRRCARCAAVMEDVTSQRSAVQFLITQQRRCFCGGCWNIIAGKQIVA